MSHPAFPYQIVIMISTSMPRFSNIKETFISDKQFAFEGRGNRCCVRSYEKNTNYGTIYKLEQTFFNTLMNVRFSSSASFSYPSSGYKDIFSLAADILQIATIIRRVVFLLFLPCF